MKQNKTSNQLSLFEVLPGFKEAEEYSPQNVISTTKVKFLSQELSTYEELFQGYNEIRVITYSYALSFIEKVMKYFNYGEVIIGFDKLINKNTADLFALQEFSTDYICHNTYLQSRINNNEFRFYVLNDLISHQKIYLLKADDGRVRTITGSANFSECAWNGDQIESVVVCDDPACYQIYASQYETLRRFSTDEISKNAVPIDENGENCEELPILKKIEKENAIVIHIPQNTEEQESVFHTNKLSQEWQNRLKSIKLKSSKEGEILFEIKHAKSLLASIKKDNLQKRKDELINPQFILDFANHTAVYNQMPFNLSPDSDAVITDLHNLMQYMEGFDLFTKDTHRLKTLYWKVLNYMFLSPFIAKLRYEAANYGYESRFFPIYMLICGNSDAGKTGFINFIRQLMFGEKLNTLTQNYFSSKPMNALKTNVKGFPILIDELTPTYWKYAKDIVKMDTTLIEQKLVNHPTFILLSNDINNIAPELSKRIIVINLNNRLDVTTAAYNGKKIHTLQKNVDNALYCEYLQRMFKAVDILIEEIHQSDNEYKNTWIPDIFKISSCVLLDILHDFKIEIPDELHTFTWFDYMGDSAIGEKAIDIIKNEYIHNSKIFNIYSNKNMLEIDFSCYDNNESKKKLQILHDELPADVECETIGTKAVLKLDAIQRHSNIKFKKKPFWRRKL